MSEIRVIDIPAKRIFEVEGVDFHRNYKCVNENGERVEMGEAPYLVVRSDSKVFKMAAFVPYGWQARDCVYLEEL